MGNWVRPAAAGCGILIAVVVIARFASVVGTSDGYNSANMAYWIQAIGSIATIGGAYVLGRRGEIFQRELTEQAHAERLKTRRSTLKALVDDAYARAKKLEFSTSGDGEFGMLAFISVSANTMQDSIDQLRSLPVFDLESGELVEAVLGIRMRCESLLSHMKYYNDNRFDPPEHYPGDYAVNATMNDHFAQLDQYYQNFLDIVGGERVAIEPPEFY